MTAESDDDILDDLFHGAAWAAFIDLANAEKGWPDCEATRERAYRYYEAALAEKNRRIAPAREAERQSLLAARHASEADAPAFIEAAADTVEGR